ncbi:MAG TPA: tripartite tricarboxylate transporter substrate-binding protein [Alphaproteobacteria bacterium]|nr:tripartite tricarboxylate transporter substrate-binding protein [Alphaproteobacteria bacterium]
MTRFALLPAVCLATAALAASASADPIADFYKGKTMQMVIATSPGGDYDTRGRLLARHMGRNIPGHPNIVPQNMPGAVGLQATNWLANLAPKDGTVLHMVMQNMPAHQALGGQNVHFDARKFNWIGNTTDSPSVVNSWYTTGITSIEQVKTKELIVGAPGTATASVYYPMVLNAIAGTKFKIIAGYPGGNDVNLAMERGEVGGRGSNTLASWKSSRPQWLTEHKINILVQVAQKRHPELPDVPLLTEMASSDADRKVMAFISADVAYARPVATTPDVPAERVKALRVAFMATMKDPELLAEAGKAQIDINPLAGDEVQKIVASVLDTPAPVIDRTKTILANEADVRSVSK